MNLIDIVIWGLVIVALVYVIRRSFKKDKSGGGCSGCSGCAYYNPETGETTCPSQMNK